MTKNDTSNGIEIVPQKELAAGSQPSRETQGVTNAESDSKVRAVTKAAASGRGNRSLPQAGTVTKLEHFVEVIGDSSRAQKAREDRRMEIDLQKLTEEKL